MNWNLAIGIYLLTYVGSLIGMVKLGICTGRDSDEPPHSYALLIALGALLIFGGLS